ncbi:MAG TPA: GNAT family N-acetyltransferase [Gammaproteobacteria bacterium]
MDRLREISENIEREALRSLHDCCPSETRDRLGLYLEECADVSIAIAERDPSILLNRALGLGSQVPVTLETLRNVASTYADHDIQRYFLHVFPDTIPDDSWLGQAGLEKARGWMKFERGGDTPPGARTDLRIERIGPEYAHSFGEIVSSAFGMSDAAIPLLAGLVHDDRWHLYLSFDGDAPAGAGAMFIDGDYAWIEWGATVPRFRRRGSQGAIMEARIRAALDQGCSHMFTETGEADGDDPQHSYGNILRFGFEPTITRENWTVAQDR